MGAQMTLKRLEDMRLRDDFSPSKYATFKEEEIEGWVKRIRWYVSARPPGGSLIWPQIDSRMITEKKGFQEAFFRIITSWDFNTLYQRWASIPATIPVHLLWGDKDAITVPSCAENIRQVVQQARPLISRLLSHTCSHRPAHFIDVS